APLTAGVYALMLAANPKLAPSTLDSILFKTAVPLGASGYDMYYGWGRVNASGAVASALQTAPAIDTTSPTASITTPSDSTTVRGLVPVSVSAADNIGVTKVVLWVNGVAYATDTISPYAFSWDTTKVPDGTNTLQATAFDAAGNQGNSAKITVTVANNTNAPKVTIASPLNGAVVSGNAAISVSATDSTTVSQITLMIDGKQVAVSSGSTLSYTWNTSTVTIASTSAPGQLKKLQTTVQSGTSHIITATATDPAGNKGSASVTVT